MENNSIYSLNLNDFGSSVRTVWEELREERDFCDVTLACEGQQIEAHKVILSGFSPVFKNLFKQNPHQHPLLYLRGVKYCELVNMLDFIYQGEIRIAQEQLNSFVNICKDFKIKGLIEHTKKLEQSESHLNHKRYGGYDEEYPSPKKKRPGLFPQGVVQLNDNLPNFVKSEPDGIIEKDGSMMFVGQDDENTAIGIDGGNDEYDDYGNYEEDPNHEVEQIRLKGKNIETKNKQKIKSIVGPKPTYEIVKGIKSKQAKMESPGVLITSKKFIYHFNKWSKNRHNAYYFCSANKSTGCKATAMVTDTIFDDGTSGEESIYGYVLSKWSEDGDHNHDGNPGRVIAERIMIEMTGKIEADPSLPITKTHNEILAKYEAEFGKEDIWNGVMGAIGLKESRLKRLRNARKKARGYLSQNAGDFKPEISKITSAQII